MNRILGMAGATVLALSLVLPVAASTSPPATASGDFHLSLPAPTGQFGVGVRSEWVIDPDRIDSATNKPRALPVRVWYPAQRWTDGPSARYMSPLVTTLVEGSLGVPAGVFEIDTHAIAGAHPRSHIKGVILASPGYGLPVATLTGLSIDLASRGYAVVAIDHPHDAAVVEAPDGTPIANDIDATTAFEAKVVDFGLVLDALPRLVPQAGRDTPIGIFGHSIGGAAAAERMRIDTRLDAGVNLDGSSRGAVVTEGLDRPFGMMLSSIHDLETAVGTKEFLSNVRAPHPVQRLDILHSGYTDFVTFNPEAAEADTTLGFILEYNQPAGTLHSLAAGRAAMAAQREFLAGFMDCYLVANRGSKAHCEPPSSY